MALSIEQVQHVAKLAELELSAAELERLATDLSAILAHVDQLRSVTGADAEKDESEWLPTTFVRLRADEPRPGVTNERALFPSAKVLDEGFAVPAFVDD